LKPIVDLPIEVAACVVACEVVKTAGSDRVRRVRLWDKARRTRSIIARSLRRATQPSRWRPPVTARPGGRPVPVRSCAIQE